MRQAELVIQNRTGLHARPAKVLVTLARQFKAEIGLQHAAKRVNAKSMVSVLTLGATHGCKITVQAEGEDEDSAIAEIEAAILSGLGDDDASAERRPGPTPAPAAAAGELPWNELREAQAAARSVIHGFGAAPGIAIGPVFHYQPTEPELEDPDSLSGLESIGLNEALTLARAQLGELQRQAAGRDGQAASAILEAQIAILEDEELTGEAQARMADGLGAARAWNVTIAARAEAIAALDDPLLAARADDLRDVGRRVLRLLLGRQERRIPWPEAPVVVIARDLSPSDTAAFDPRHVLGFGIVGGGPASHVAILARALGLPALVGADKAILALAEKTRVVLNGHDGTLTVDPAPEVVSRVTGLQNRWLERRRAAMDRADEPAVTLDGQQVTVTANAGSLADAAAAWSVGADGIGLLRTEFLFLERNAAPGEEEQYGVYRAIAETMNGRPVIVRTLDVGGDKPLPYIPMKAEMNPFLGERGIRLCLNRPELFRAQLRAILRAAPSGNLRIMFPMVGDVSDVRQARALLEEACRELNLPAVPVGMMVEIPSAALLADKFAPEVDFFSIGTNDLTQYTLAVDRGDAGLAARYDGLHPAVLRLIARTVEAAHQSGKRADLCGELASDALAMPVLVGLGVDELSVAIPAVPIVKARMRMLRAAEARQLAREALDRSTAREVREMVKGRFPDFVTAMNE